MEIKIYEKIINKFKNKKQHFIDKYKKSNKEYQKISNKLTILNMIESIFCMVCAILIFVGGFMLIYAYFNLSMPIKKTPTSISRR